MRPPITEIMMVTSAIAPRQAHELGAESRNNDAQSMLFIGQNVEQVPFALLFCVGEFHQL